MGGEINVGGEISFKKYAYPLYHKYNNKKWDIIFYALQRKLKQNFPIFLIVKTMVVVPYSLNITHYSRTPRFLLTLSLPSFFPIEYHKVCGPFIGYKKLKNFKNTTPGLQKS